MTHTFTRTYVTCPHDPRRVTANIAHDADPTGNYFIQWCQVCGAYRCGEYIGPNEPGITRSQEIKWVADWTEPELRRISGDDVRFPGAALGEHAEGE